MDPHLWELLKEGNDEDEVAAILRLGQPGAVPEGVRLVTQFGDIATVRLKRGAIRDVRDSAEVFSMKPLEPLAPEPEVEPLGTPENLPESFPWVDDRRPQTESATGRGVVVGVIDWGCDFAHPDFRHPDGRTRLLALWDQSARPESGASNRYGYGEIYTTEAINRALAADDPYAALGYHPADSDPGQDGTHGTHVMGIAAGNGRGEGPVGVAPEADLVFVQHSTLSQEGRYKLGDSVTLLEAVDFIAQTAGERPWVINLSMGRHGGEHSGRTLVEQGLDAALRAAPGRAISQSAGNYYQRRCHTTGQLRPGEERTFVWEIDEVDVTPNELEVWYPGRDVLIVEVSSPDGTLSRRVALGERASLTLDGREVGNIYHRAHEPNNLDNHIDIFLYPGAPAGNWQVTLIAQDVVDGEFHAWIERDALRPHDQSQFSPEDAVPSSTTGTIANGFRTVSVGAYDPHSPDQEVAPFSSCGPTRDHRLKPSLCAPGVYILAARSAPRDRHGETPVLTRKSGTSMASPHVAGTLALMFEVAPRPLRIEETHNLLLSSVRKVPASPEMVNRIGGYLDIDRAIEVARRGGSVGPQLKPESVEEKARMPREDREIVPQALDQESFEEDRYPERVVTPEVDPSEAEGGELINAELGRHYPAAGRYAIELDGVIAGWAFSAEGGYATADVVVGKPGPDRVARKHVVGVKYEDITVNCGAGMSKGFYEWIKATFDRKYVRKNGAIIATDYDYKERSRLNFHNALITEISFPALDAASKDAAKMMIKIAPEYTHGQAGSGTPVGGHVHNQAVEKWLRSDFRLKIDGLDCTHVNKIGAITLRLKGVENPVGKLHDHEKEPAYLEVSNLVVTLPESHSKEFYDWHENFVIKGNNGQGNEKNGTLEYLAPNSQEVLFSLTLKHLGIFQLSPEKVDVGSQAIRRVRAEMYCEEMNFSYSGGAIGSVRAPAPSGNAPIKAELREHAALGEEMPTGQQGTLPAREEAVAPSLDLAGREFDPAHEHRIEEIDEDDIIDVDDINGEGVADMDDGDQTEEDVINGEEADIGAVVGDGEFSLEGRGWQDGDLVSLANEAVAAGQARLPGALIGEVLSRAGMVAHRSAPFGAGSSAHIPSAAEIFDAFAYSGREGLRQDLERFLEVVALPGERLRDDLRPGDILLRRALGEGTLAHAALLTAGRVFRIEELASAGRRAESARPGLYVEVVEAGCFPHRLEDGFTRRLGEEHGQLGYDSLILRARSVAQQAGELTANLAVGIENPEEVAIEIEETGPGLGFEVNRRGRLDSFLRRKGVQNYRIPILIACKGIQIIRGGTVIVPSKPDDPIEAGDRVEIPGPLPEACQKAIDTIPETDYRDYAFVAPGGPKGGFEEQARRVFAHRVQTVLIDDALVDSLSSFLRSLRTHELINNPIRNILVSSHSNPEGRLQIPLDLGGDRVITYEDLEGATTLAIPDEILTPRPKDSAGKEMPPFLHFKGCRIGLTLPYLKLLKKRLGGKVSVTAPKLFEVVAQHVSPDGFAEYMLTGYQINRPKQFRDQADAIKGFDGEGFQSVDGVTVPSKKWRAWIPTDPNSTKDYKEFKLKTEVYSPIVKAARKVPSYFRYRKRRLFDSPSSIDLAVDPKTEKGRKDEVKVKLQELDRYKDSHPFPEYVRFGYTSMDAFMDGWTWNFKYDNKKKLLHFQATRYEYTVMQPVVDAKDNSLYINFYPTDPRDKPIIQLRESDVRFYAIV